MMVFDESNVRFVWDDSLVGRPCYFADSVAGLVNAVTSQDSDSIGVVAGFGTLEEPFSINLHGVYSFVYPTDVKQAWSYSASYVHFDWDVSLDGRRGLMANSIGQIISLVCRNASPQFIYKTVSNEYPFKDIDGHLYKFAYFDPYYDFRHALLNGEPVEVMYDNKWHPLEHCTFVEPLSHYRFKYESTFRHETSPAEVHEGTQPKVELSDPACPTEKATDVQVEASRSRSFPVTNQELSYWIAQGKGEMVFSDDGEVCDGLVAVHSYEYDLGETDSPVPSNILVRTWGRDGWVSPTRSYLGLK